MQHKNDYNGTNRLTIILFIVYLIVLSWILLLKLGVQFSYMAERRTNLFPFSQSSILSGENVLNVIVFVPMGVYAGILFSKRWLFGKKLFIVFLISLLIESLQYILRIGAFDVTDVVTNTFGGMIGLLIVKVLAKALGDDVTAQRFVNRIAAPATALLILLLVLLKMNLLPVRYQ